MNKQWIKEIEKASRKAANDWPGVAEAEDIDQEVWVKILEAPGTQRDLAEMDDNARYQTLHKLAQRVASKERNDYSRFSGNFRYSVSEVRSLLESAGDPEASELGSSWSTGDYTRSGGEHSDPTADAALRNIQLSTSQKELAAALGDLKESNSRQYDALVQRFVEGKVPHRDDDSTVSLIKRGVVSVTNKMNHAHKRNHSEGTPIRKAISNSTARYLSKEGYDADYMPAPSHLRDNHIEKEVWE